MKIESRIISIIEGQTHAPVTKSLLQLMSGAYRIGSILHRGAYDTVIPRMRLAVPVLSVGNIVSGGSGKTPTVEYLARALAPKKVAILSRGYKRKGKATLVLDTDTPVEESGDEPKLLKTKLPDAQVIVGRNRAFSGHLAQVLEADVILLDDGLQHHCLHRDRDIVTLDAENLLGKGRFLPYGYLRERPKVLAEADLLVLSSVRDETHFIELMEQLQQWTDAPIMSMKRTYPNQSAISGKRIGALCAIASPQRFFQALSNLGCEILCETVKPDHEPFSYQELVAIANRAKDKGAELLVYTEKDAIKWPKVPKLPLPLASLEMIVEPQFGKIHIESLINGV